MWKCGNRKKKNYINCSYNKWMLIINKLLADVLNARKGNIGVMQI